jgi:hypothetical protein
MFHFVLATGSSFKIVKIKEIENPIITQTLQFLKMYILPNEIQIGNYCI